jgi:hypothetical protein
MDDPNENDTDRPTKVRTVTERWDPFPGAGEQDASPLARRVTPAQAQRISAAFDDLRRRREDED